MNGKHNSDALFNSCYCTHVTKIEQVHELMKRHGDIEGLYLVRNSFSEKGRLVLSVRHGSGLVHIKVGHNSDRNTYFLGSKTFKNMDALLIHFSHHPIENEEGVANVLLNHPIRVVWKTDPNAIRTQTTPTSHHTCYYENTHLMCHSENLQQMENHLRNAGYLTPTFTLANKRRLPSLPPENQCIYVKAYQSHDLPRGWSVSSEPGREVKFISPSGSVEDNLPAEVWSQLNDRQSLAVRKLLSGDVCNDEDSNHEYLDMNKSNKNRFV